MVGKQKIGKAKKQLLKEKKGHITLFPMWFQIAATLRVHDLCAYSMHEMADH